MISPRLELWGDVGKQGRPKLAVLVSPLPKVTLQALEVRDLDITAHEVLDVVGQGCRSNGMLLGKRFPILGKLRTVPLRLQGAGEGRQSIRELKGTRGRITAYHQYDIRERHLSFWVICKESVCEVWSMDGWSAESTAAGQDRTAKEIRLGRGRSRDEWSTAADPQLIPK